MALFFLAALAVFLLARVFGRLTVGRLGAMGPPLAAAGLMYGFVLLWALVGAWINARETDSRDAIVAAVKALASLGDYQSAQLIGGALAGVILYDGFRRTQKMSDVSEGALKNSAIVILPAALFLAVAILSREGVLERITGLEAGGVKVTMQPMGGAGAPDGIGQSRPAVAGGGVIQNNFPYLRLLNDLIKKENRFPDMITRDLEIIGLLSGSSGREAVEAVRPTAEAHRVFLRLFADDLECLTQYVELSNDTRLTAIAGVEIALGFVVLERALQGNQGIRGPSNGSKLVLRRMLKKFGDLRRNMGDYLRAAGIVADNKCGSGSTGAHHLPIASPGHSEPSSTQDERGYAEMNDLWQQNRNAPYMTLAAAWLGSAYKDPGLAAKLLITWLADNEPLSTATPDLALAWFRVRTLIQLVNIMPSAFGGTEPAAARHALDATWREFEALPGLPSLERYARSIVKGKADDCPKIGSKLSDTDASLYHTRIFILARRLHAVVDNPDPTNRLNAYHMRLAHALKEADPVCIPGDQPRKAFDMRALGAIHQIVFARVAFAWASDPAVSREQAEDLRKQGRDALRKGLDELDSLYADWRHKPQYENGRPLSDLEKHLQRGFDYFSDLERARWLAQELLR